MEFEVLLWKAHQCKALCIHTENYILSVEGGMHIAPTVSIGNRKRIYECIIQFIPNETMNFAGY